MSYVNPYTTAAHGAWIANGNCPAIHITKAWCNDPVSHRGDHRAPHIRPDGTVEAWLYWNDADNHPRSATA